jgi:hypothetical protein
LNQTLQVWCLQILTIEWPDKKTNDSFYMNDGIDAVL